MVWHSARRGTIKITANVLRRMLTSMSDIILLFYEYYFVNTTFVRSFSSLFYKKLILLSVHIYILHFLRLKLKIIFRKLQWVAIIYSFVVNSFVVQYKLAIWHIWMFATK